MKDSFFRFRAGRRSDRLLVDACREDEDVSFTEPDAGEKESSDGSRRRPVWPASIVRLLRDSGEDSPGSPSSNRFAPGRLPELAPRCKVLPSLPADSGPDSSSLMATLLRSTVPPVASDRFVTALREMSGDCALPAPGSLRSSPTNACVQRGSVGDSCSFGGHVRS